MTNPMTTTNPTATTMSDSDYLYQQAAKQIHRSKNGDIKIGEMTIAHLQATLRIKAGHFSAVWYRVVLERKLKGGGR